MKTASWIVALAASAAMGSFSFAQVTGKVKLDGAAPEMKTIDMSGVKECNAQHADPVTEETVIVGEKGELDDVIVSLKKEEGQEIEGAAVPKTPAVIDQKGCMYTPHVVAMMVGQDLLIKNDDPFLHNVHSLAQTNASFNFGQPNKDEGKKVPEAPKAVETYKVKCDVHPWMLAWVRVLDNPFFATSGEDGSFKIDGKLPDGEYTFVAWHEKFGEQEQKATVKDGKAEVNFTFKAAAAQAQPAVKEILVDFANAKTCPTGKGCCGKPVDPSTAQQPAKGIEPQAKAN